MPCHASLHASEHLHVLLLQYPEFGLQALLTALMVFSGRWLVGGLHLIVLAFNVRLVFLQQHRVDVTGAAGLLLSPAFVAELMLCRCHSLRHPAGEV